MQKIKREDEVIVISGKYKGKRGAVLKILPGDRVLVAGINVAKKHAKPNPQKGIPGGIVNKEMPLHISNVAIFNPETGMKDKVAIRFEEGQKVRVFKSNQALLPGK